MRTILEENDKRDPAADDVFISNLNLSYVLGVLQNMFEMKVTQIGSRTSHACVIDPDRLQA